MTAALAYATPPIRLHIRDAMEQDRAYILDSWRMGWRLSDACRRLKSSAYASVFRDRVANGVLAQPDTRVLVGCSRDDTAWIWAWLCYTPGPVPTVHFAVTRPRIDLEAQRVELRRLGFLKLMLAAAGVRDELVYTFRPAERSNDTSKKILNAEAGLLEGAAAVGITAVHLPVGQFLSQRRRRT